MAVAKSHLRRVTRCAHRIEEARHDLIDAIVEARDSGESFRDIAEAAGLSHQRIHQLVKDPSRTPRKEE